jgi:hypothetical protein
MIPTPVREGHPRTPAVLLLVACLLPVGCYTYLPLGTLEPQVGTQVSAELTWRGSDTLAAAVGPGVTTVRGAVLQADPAAVILAVASVANHSGQQQFWRGEPVRLPRGSVQGFEERKFSVGRTVLLGAAFLGSSLAAWAAFKGDRSGGRLPGGSGGGVPQ